LRHEEVIREMETKSSGASNTSAFNEIFKDFDIGIKKVNVKLDIHDG